MTATPLTKESTNSPPDLCLPACIKTPSILRKPRPERPGTNDAGATETALEHMRALGNDGGEDEADHTHINFRPDTGLHAEECTWRQFREAMLRSEELPFQLLSDLYDVRFVPTSIEGVKKCNEHQPSCPEHTFTQPSGSVAGPRIRSPESQRCKPDHGR